MKLRTESGMFEIDSDVVKIAKMSLTSLHEDYEVNTKISFADVSFEFWTDISTEDLYRVIQQDDKNTTLVLDANGELSVHIRRVGAAQDATAKAINASFARVLSETQGYIASLLDTANNQGHRIIDVLTGIPKTIKQRHVDGSIKNSQQTMRFWRRNDV